jgi:hypothetical protein
VGGGGGGGGRGGGGGGMGGMNSGLLKEFSSAKELFASALRRTLLSRGGGV